MATPESHAKMWDSRRQKYGVSGQQASAARRDEHPSRALFDELLARRSTCRRGHDLRVYGRLLKPRGTWYLACRACFNLRRRAWRAARKPAGLIEPGLTSHQAAYRRVVATKLAKYGSTQMSPAGRERQREGARGALSQVWARKRAQTHCKHGHEFNEKNTRYTGRGHRQCRPCAVAAQRRRRIRRQPRPTHVEVHGVRISILAHDQFFLAEHAHLRRKMMAAHPDMGGSSRAFITARAALQRFVSDERQWYAPYNLQPPNVRGSSQTSTRPRDFAGRFL